MRAIISQLKALEGKDVIVEFKKTGKEYNTKIEVINEEDGVICFIISTPEKATHSTVIERHINRISHIEGNRIVFID